jgi:hypothetical protein
MHNLNIFLIQLIKNQINLNYMNIPISRKCQFLIKKFWQ